MIRTEFKVSKCKVLTKIQIRFVKGTLVNVEKSKKKNLENNWSYQYKLAFLDNSLKSVLYIFHLFPHSSSHSQVLFLPYYKL